MPQFVFSARVELEGVQLIVEAETEEQARQKIKAREWDNEELRTASWVNWSLGRLISQND